MQERPNQRIAAGSKPGRDCSALSIIVALRHKAYGPESIEAWLLQSIKLAREFSAEGPGDIQQLARLLIGWAATGSGRGRCLPGGKRSTKRWPVSEALDAAWAEALTSRLEPNSRRCPRSRRTNECGQKGIHFRAASSPGS